jgi:hypothetical protein
MAYRNDRDAHIARIDALESELAEARERIRELEAQPPVTIERVVERAVERDPAPEPRDGPAMPAPPPMPVMKAPLAVRVPGPYPVQATTAHANGRTVREYVFDRELPLESGRELVRTLGEQLGRRGRIEILARSAAWSSGGQRIEIARRGGVTVLTCSDARARHDWTGLAVLASALAIACWMMPHAAIFIASAIAALLSGLLVILVQPARKQASHELFDRVAGMLGAELPGRALPAGPAIAAHDERAR